MANKIALIVGPGHAGLGQAMAEQLGAQGYTIALMGRQAEPLADLVKVLSGEGVTAFSMAADAADPTSVTKALATISAQGSLQLVHYNATQRTKNKPSQLTAALVAESLASNLLGAITVTNLSLPYVEKTGNGVFLYTGSVVAAKPGPTDVEQAIGKAGLRDYVVALNKELHAQGVFAGMVTINTYIRQGKAGHMDPTVIARAFIELATQKNAAEVQYH
ncbi:SDR family NAD(P)-dependent oxidoreductase [Schleiferilactobacillus harbinensis]|uniref:SDR family NAD(P)-dependent oxidoreductase n=1 Tax=Schleiferilactobacillus harbinensis TaxID=304207 RepID=A0A510TYC0_9LACO|nr:SDR family NAD(P)-dependent oxidoreductase [Schleiferilactobacillus harbinensis]QFR22423.1 SDR family NAD(P)-dependent oxidoreductase [Schleiferilactobacillus harbinensis]GEK07272.1 3-oxoacyl-ACP reductase [Schleiferilactobacillus harbinensis]